MGKHEVRSPDPIAKIERVTVHGVSGTIINVDYSRILDPNLPPPNEESIRSLINELPKKRHSGKVFRRH